MHTTIVQICLILIYYRKDPITFNICGELTDEQIAAMKEKFILFDDDNDGAIDKTELEAVMKYMGQTPTKIEIQEMINNLDADGTGVLEFSEFLKLAQSIKNKDPLLFEVSNNLTEADQEKVKDTV